MKTVSLVFIVVWCGNFGGKVNPKAARSPAANSSHFIFYFYHGLNLVTMHLALRNAVRRARSWTSTKLGRAFSGGKSFPKAVVYSPFDRDMVPTLNLVVANGPVCPDQLSFFLRRSTRLYCADGGAIALSNHFRRNPEDAGKLTPTIVGDFDSVSPKLLQYFENLGAIIEHVHDQDRNDLEKALASLRLVAVSSRCSFASRVPLHSP